jgi:signal transduction histidine kinase
LLLCLPFSFPFAAAAEYRFDRWTGESGLPQNAVYSILQTRDGYLWLTTLDGLVRYDGVRFTVFDKSNTKEFVTSRFIRLFEAHDGSLWIVAEDNGLVVYQGGRFTSYTTEDGLPSKDVRVVREDEAGNILVFTTGGTARYQNGRFVRAAEHASLPVSLIFRHWFGGASYADAAGLHVFRGGRYQTYAQSDGLPSLNVTSLYEDQRGVLWAGTKDAGLFRLKDGRFTSYTARDGLPALEVNLKAAYEDREGNVWLATDRGLGRLKDGKFISYSETPGLSNQIVHNFYEDREGNLWLGTHSEGLFRIRKQSVTVYSERDGLSLNNVYTILEDREGRVWTGTWGEGLNRFKDGVFTRRGGKGWPPHTLITALYEDREGRLWIAHDAGLSILKDDEFTAFSGNDVVRKLLVQAILQDRAGTFWFGCLAGLVKYEGGQLTVYTTKDGLADNNVTTLLGDSAGALWIGTYKGLSCFKDGKFINYAGQEGLRDKHVRALHEDAEGVLWIGTYDSGLVRLKDGGLTSYTTRDGLFNNGAFHIIEDEAGQLWMSCNRGIYRVGKRELNDFAAGRLNHVTSISYGKEDGMLSVECNGGRQPAGWQTRDGRLWFPTQGGVAVIDPKSLSVNTEPPPVLIEEVFVEGQPVGFNRPVEMFPGQNSFEIHYTGLSFIKPEHVRFKYKLEGLDGDWVDAGARRTAYYSYVPPGTYTFRVLAANSDGVWNERGTSVRLVVLPPFWRTWWFYGLLAASVAGAAWLIYERRVRQLKRAHETQLAFSRQLIASQERERKRIAAELHDSLGQSLVVIKTQAALGLSRPDDHARALEQMAEISTAASEAISEVKEIAYNLRPYQLDRLGLTKAVEGILEKVSASSDINFSARLDEIDGVFSKEAEINIYRIVQESLNNILKHSAATEARLEIKRDGRGVLITIQDNGQGFTPETGERARGLGLMGISERARMLGAKHELKSVPGKGTSLTIHLGLEDSHSGT